MKGSRDGVATAVTVATINGGISTMMAQTARTDHQLPTFPDVRRRCRIRCSCSRNGAERSRTIATLNRRRISQVQPVAGLDDSVRNTPPGTRTPNPLIKSQLLYRLS